MLRNNLSSSMKQPYHLSVVFFLFFFSVLLKSLVWMQNKEQKSGFMQYGGSHTGAKPKHYSLSLYCSCGSGQASSLCEVSSRYIITFYQPGVHKDICSNAGCLTPHSANHFFLFLISSNFSLRLRMDVHASM